MKRRLTKTTSAALTLACSLLAPALALAADAGLSRVLPRGAQRGGEVEVKLSGKNLDDAQEVVFYAPGITAKDFKVVNKGEVSVKLAVAPDARLGEHLIRVRTASGISDVRSFWVGAFPVIEEVEPNNEFDAPQKIGTNITVSGVVKNEDVDYFVVQAKKGERITAEVEGVRLAAGENSLFDPYLAILDPNRFELAACDDTALLLQDTIVSVVAPADGNYVIQMREASYGGSDNAWYRLHVGNYPRPRTVYPAGGKAGDDVNLSFVGDVGGVITQSLRLPSEPNEKLGLFAEQNGQSSPSPCYVRVSTFGNQLEVEPNNDAATASKYGGELPIAFNGVISQYDDVDFFRFTAKKGQVYDVNVYARRLRSPLDAVLTIHNKDGGQIGQNDDSGNPDSYLRWTVPSDGEFLIGVRDHLKRGSADSVYRVEVAPVEPSLSAAIPPVDPNGNSQERMAVVVPRGNRYATLMRVKRTNVGGEVALAPVDLPPGVTMQCENMAAGLDVVPVVFEAAADAPVGGRLADVTVKSLDPAAKDLTGKYVQQIVMVGNGNQDAFYTITTNKMPVAVAAEAHYSVRIESPKVPLVQSGQMSLKVVADRKKDFDAPIRVRLLFNPPGVSSGEVEIPKGQNEVLLPLNATDAAPIRKWKTCVLTSADFPEGKQWISSALTEIDVAPGLAAGKIEQTAGEQGKQVQVTVKLENKTKFDGEAMLKLLGLPNLATAAEKKIKATDTEVIFDVQLDPKTPATNNNALFCQIELPQNGDTIIQTFAMGGVMRVDAPPPPKPDAKPEAKKPEPKPGEAKKPEKPISRLEKLRLEQQGKTEGK